MGDSPGDGTLGSAFEAYKRFRVYNPGALIVRIGFWGPVYYKRFRVYRLIGDKHL